VDDMTKPKGVCHVSSVSFAHYYCKAS
jgi:hypothetical protein